MTKILLPNQCDLLHPFYGRDDCCLCRAEQRVKELEALLRRAMNWSYVAGYSDGEGCLLLGVTQEKRLDKRGNSQVDGWGICPSWAIQSYDYSTLEECYEFLLAQGFEPRTLDAPRESPPRSGHTKIAWRISIGGWQQLDRLFNILIPLTIVKRKQYELFLELVGIILAKPKGERKRSWGGCWTKELFIEAMEKVDEINALKSRQRGGMNAQFFRNLWQKGGDA